MKIKELNIIEFGGLKDKKISFDDGMNIISGANEAGKSTIMLFIKYMLYGLPRKSASNPERERAVSLDGKRASGSMIFEAKGRRYIAERHFQGARGSDSFKLTDADLGEEIKLDQQIGEYFLGVPKEVFESSAEVGQMKASEINGEKTVSVIENILVSADESVDTAKVLGFLDKIRTEYLHKNRGGGKLYHAELEIAEMREKLRVSKEKDASLLEQKTKLEEKKIDLEKAEKEYARLDKAYDNIRSISIISQFDRLHKAEAELEGAKLKIEKFKLKNPDCDTAATRTHNLEDMTAEYSAACEEIKNAEAVLESVKALSGDEVLAKEGERFSLLGGKEKIIADAERKKRKAASGVAIGASLLILAAIVAAVGFVIGNIDAILLLGAFIGAAAIVGIVGILSLVSGAKNKKSFREAIAPYNSLSELEEHITLCLENVKLCSAKREALTKAEIEAETARRHERRIYQKISDSLGENRENVIGLASAEIDRLKAIGLEWEELCFEERRLSESVRTISEPLSDFNENELRASIDIDVSEINEGSLDAIAKERRFYAMKIDNMRQNLKSYETMIIQNEANFIDPLEIADHLAVCESKHKEDSEFFEALVLAMESIESASERLRGSITPEIKQRASDIMSIISGGRYEELNTGKKLQPSVISNGIPMGAELLSGGTRDSVYLALRIALMSQIFSEDMPPLMLDEALCQLDDKRAAETVSLLSELTKTDMQILLFTCHSREAQICERLGVNVNVTEL